MPNLLETSLLQLPGRMQSMSVSPIKKAEKGQSKEESATGLC